MEVCTRILVRARYVLDGDDALALALALLVHLDVRAGGRADGVDVGARAPDHARDRVGCHAHFLTAVMPYNTSSHVCHTTIFIKHL